MIQNNKADSNIVINDNNYRWYNDSWMPTGRTTTALEAGVYEVGDFGNGPAFRPMDINTDELIYFTDMKYKDILDGIRNFWTSKDKFQKYGFLQRIGYLLIGPPGSGKTILVEQIMEQIIADNGLVFMCSGNPAEFTEALTDFRVIEPNRPVLCVYEDIDALIARYGEPQFLSCLDGEKQINYVVNIGTTNYPERLNKRIINRPRRFDNIVLIDYPNESIRREYFAKKLQLDTRNAEIDIWVKYSNNFSFAACADLVICVKCLDYTIEDSSKKIADLLKNEPHSKNFEDAVPKTE